MLGVGWTEMLLIGVVALIVIGPKELPALMQKVGRFAGAVRRMGADFQREINKATALDEVRNIRTSIAQPLKATTDAIRKEFNTIGASGSVTPSGALKPADPKAESVVAEIHAAAGITPAATTTRKTPRKRVAKAKAAPTGKVERAPLPPVKPVESPAPIEAIAPAAKAAKPARKRAAARPKPAGEKL